MTKSILKLIEDGMEVLEAYVNKDNVMNEQMPNQTAPKSLEYEVVIQTFSRIENYFRYLEDFIEEHGISKQDYHNRYKQYETLKQKCSDIHGRNGR